MSLIRVNGYPMDIATSESHSFPGEVTKFPVESGGDISDHIRDLPPVITLECIVSDSPSGEVARDATRQLDVTGDGLINPNALPVSADALAYLRDLKAQRKLVTVETSLGIFEQMAFVELDVPRDAERNHALFFTARFERVNVVTNQRTRTRVRTEMAGAGKGGKKSPKVTVGKAIRIDASILWQHGNPPGSPWLAGQPQETISVQYSKPPGLTGIDAAAFGRANPESPYVKYFYEQGPLAGTEILGIPKLDLIKDLQRDREAERRKPIAAGGARRVPIAAGGAHKNLPGNLPLGTNLSRWQRAPDAATFGTPTVGVP